MKTRRVMGIALMMALFLTALVFTSAGAAPANQGAGKLKPTYTTVQLKGKSQVASASRAPVNDARPVYMDTRLDRAIPGKVRAAIRADSIPVVAALPVDNLKTGKTFKGLNAFDMRAANGTDITPPDQALCASGKYVLEIANIVMTVYDANLNRLMGDFSVDSLFGYAPGSFNVGDPRCYFDPDTRRFFVTVSDQAAPSGSAVDIAVSMTDNPMLGWYLYQIDTSDSTLAPCPCVSDQPFLGADRYGLFISTNQFPTAGGFAGANLYIFDKFALSLGSLLVNQATYHVGMDLDTPDGSCLASGGVFCWSSLQPATSPSATSWDKRNNGTEYMLSSLDFAGAGDNRIALWAITNTQSMMGTTPSLNIQYVTLTGQSYTMPPAAVQKNDNILDAGQFYYGWNPADGAGPIATNDDRMNATIFTANSIWGGLNTAVLQGKTRELHAGITFYGVRPVWSTTGVFNGKMIKQAFISPLHADAMFPSIGLNPRERGIINFSLSGARYYPSTAYVTINPYYYVPSPVHIAAPGMGSLDDYCEYPAANCAQDPNVPTARPRFGNYSASVVVGEIIYFANEYVQSPECLLSVFGTNLTCSNTRSTRTNWGTSLSKIVPPITPEIR